jgi:hypothetical protein
MAIRDYLEDKVEVTEDFKGIPFKRPQTASVSLASVDSDMEQAQKAAQNRGRREAIQKQIDNLENHNKELRASLENLRKNTLSNMDEDNIVAMAKAKGIKNEDIDAWLKGRAQRSARDISRAQTRELEKQAEELKEQNKAQDVQAIYEADQDYAKAFEEAKYRSQDETEASMDKNVLAKKNKLDTLKSQFKRRYGVTWDDYTKQPEEKENLSVTVTEEEKEKGKGGEVVLQDEEAAVLDETTLQKFNERDTTNKEKRAIKAEAQKKVRQKSESAKARKEQLNSIKTDLAILGIKSPDDVYTVMNTFETSQYRNDKDKRDAYDRIVRFKRSDKEFNTFKKLGNLLTGK